MIFVTGLVLKPSGYKYIPGYGLEDYLAMSGGVSDYGSKHNILIYRNGESIKYQNLEISKYSKNFKTVDHGILGAVNK